MSCQELCRMMIRKATDRPCQEARNLSLPQRPESLKLGLRPNRLGLRLPEHRRQARPKLLPGARSNARGVLSNPAAGYCPPTVYGRGRLRTNRSTTRHRHHPTRAARVPNDRIAPHTICRGAIHLLRHVAVPTPAVHGTLRNPLSSWRRLKAPVGARTLQTLSVSGRKVNRTSLEHRLGSH